MVGTPDATNPGYKQLQMTYRLYFRTPNVRRAS